jgi:hypothetical protein
MKQSIWKFPLKTTDYQKVKMPVNAKILCVQAQNETPCIWAIVNTEAEQEEREFEIYGTGHPFYEGDHYGKEKMFVGTYQLRNGGLVFHVFELVEIEVISGL